jgi:tRNA pseudouridine13 synthase
LRQFPEDFAVEEILGFEPDGEGEHSFVQVEKRGLNTADVERQLAGIAGVPPRDIGFSGMKDKHAVTRQWFSVGLAGREEPDWTQLNGDQITVLHTARHRKKLRRGVHRANRFRLRLRGVTGDREELVQRLQRVAAEGVPNYFGEQRFGRRGDNITAGKAWLIGGGRAPRRAKRGIYLSALRALLFNSLLAEKVVGDDWQSPGTGEVAMLAGSNSVFRCEDGDEDIEQRALKHDLHLALPLWGEGARREATAWQDWQEQVLAGEVALCEALVGEKLKLAYRPARLLADDLYWQFCDDDLTVGFELGSGGFATAVLRELAVYKDLTRQGSEAVGKQA